MAQKESFASRKINLAQHARGHRNSPPDCFYCFAIALFESLDCKKNNRHPCGIPVIFGAEGEIRTLAAVSHPTPLAGAPRHQLEYFCKTDYLTHTVKFSTVRCVNNITKLFLKVNMKCYIILILFS